MRIASRPAAHYGTEFEAIEKEDLISVTDPKREAPRLPTKSRMYEKDSKCVVFMSDGKARKNYSKGTKYTFFVEISPEEMICGLALLSPEIVSAAVEKSIRMAELARHDVYTDAPRNETPKKTRASSLASRVVETVNAISIGLVSCLLGETGNP